MRFNLGKRTFRFYFSDTSIDLYEIKKVLDKDSKNYGNEVESVVGYFSDFSSIYPQLIKIGLTEANCTDFLDIRNSIENTKSILKDLLKDSK